MLKGHSAPVRSVDFSHDARQLLTASDDKTVKLWSLPSRKFVQSFSGHSHWARSAKFSPDARVVVSGSDDKTVKLWDVSSGRCIATFFEHSGWGGGAGAGACATDAYAPCCRPGP